MAATAQEKAYNLKDSYVAGLLEGGATAPIQGMTEQDMGNQASVHYDLNNNLVHGTNDNDPTVFITNGYDEYPGQPRTRSVDSLHPLVEANPVSFGVSEVAPYGARNTSPLNLSGQKEAIEHLVRSRDPHQRTYREPRFTSPGIAVN